MSDKTKNKTTVTNKNHCAMRHGNSLLRCVRLQVGYAPPVTGVWPFPHSWPGRGNRGEEGAGDSWLAQNSVPDGLK